MTLFATGDSETSAKLESIYPRALYRDSIPWDNSLYSLLNIANCFEGADKYDIIHCHIDRQTEYSAIAMSKLIRTPVIFTLHFMLSDVSEKQDRRVFLTHYRDSNYVSISNSQRQSLPNLHFVSTVYNGIDVKKYDFQSKPGDKLVWLGRISRSKGTLEAIKIAQKSKRKLILAGKIDRFNNEDIKYFSEEIEPLIDQKNIKYIGEVSDAEKNELFKEAYALINPILWEEPFGLVPVEAMAAGVPVIAFERGAMPELIVDGEDGFLVNNVEEAVEALKKLPMIDRLICRQHAQNKFSVEKMVSGYLSAYQQVLKSEKDEDDLEQE